MQLSQTFAFLAHFASPEYTTAHLHSTTVAIGSQQCATHQKQPIVTFLHKNDEPSKGIVVDIVDIDIGDYGCSCKEHELCFAEDSVFYCACSDCKCFAYHDHCQHCYMLSLNFLLLHKKTIFCRCKLGMLQRRRLNWQFIL